MNTETFYLRRCPFCASTDVHNERYAMVNAPSQVVCMGCGAMSKEAASQEEASIMWNQRTPTEKENETTD